MNRRAFLSNSLRSIGAAVLFSFIPASTLFADSLPKFKRFIFSHDLSEGEFLSYMPERAAWLYQLRMSVFGKDYYVSDWMEDPKHLPEIRQAAIKAFRRVAISGIRG